MITPRSSPISSLVPGCNPPRATGLVLAEIGSLVPTCTRANQCPWQPLGKLPDFPQCPIYSPEVWRIDQAVLLTEIFQNQEKTALPTFLSALIRCVTLFDHLTSRRTDFTLCLQPSFERDGEALRKFLQFDTKFNILHRKKA